VARDPRSDLCAREDAAWTTFRGILQPLAVEELLDPTVTPAGWSAKDVMFHVGAWLAECGRMFERMLVGTYVDEDVDVDGLNEEWFQISRRVDLRTALAELMSARNRMLASFDELPAFTAEAGQWFMESGEHHYREHADDLRAWIGRKGAGGSAWLPMGAGP
jgi:hypothetical protein